MVTNHPTDASKYRIWHDAKPSDHIWGTHQHVQVLAQVAYQDYSRAAQCTGREVANAFSMVAFDNAVGWMIVTQPQCIINAQTDVRTSRSILTLPVASASSPSS